MEKINFEADQNSYRHLKFALKRSDVYNPAKFNQAKIKYYLRSWYRFLNLIATQNDHQLVKPYQFNHHWLLVLNQSVLVNNVLLADQISDQDEVQYQYQFKFWINVYPYQLDQDDNVIIINDQAQVIPIEFYQNEYEGFASPFGIKNYQSVYEQLQAIDQAKVF